MRGRLTFAAAWALALAGLAEAQPIVPYGNAPIITAPVPPSTIIRRFSDDPTLTVPGGSPATGSKAPRRDGRPGSMAQPPSAGTTATPQDQRPLVCQTVGPRTVCE